MSSLCITGTGSGFGFELTAAASRKGLSVVSLGRTHSPLASNCVQADLEGLARGEITEAFNDLFDCEGLILNAFVSLPPTLSRDLHASDFLRNLELNLLSTKVIVDFLLKNSVSLTRVADVSSGASEVGYQGWLAYCTGKASIASMLRVYQSEFPEKLFRSISPGPLRTDLNSRLLSAANGFDWLDKLSSDSVRDPSDIAPLFLDTFLAMSKADPNLIRI